MTHEARARVLEARALLSERRARGAGTYAGDWGHGGCRARRAEPAADVRERPGPERWHDLSPRRAARRIVRLFTGDAAARLKLFNELNANDDDGGDDTTEAQEC